VTPAAHKAITVLDCLKFEKAAVLDNCTIENDRAANWKLWDVCLTSQQHGPVTCAHPCQRSIKDAVQEKDHILCLLARNSFNAQTVPVFYAGKWREELISMMHDSNNTWGCVSNRQAHRCLAFQSNALLATLLKRNIPIFCYNFMHLKRVASETDTIFCNVCKEGTERLFKVQI
jgi:hypothetical protein